MLTSNPVKNPVNYVDAPETIGEGERSLVDSVIVRLSNSISLAQANFDFLESKLLPYSKPTEVSEDKCERIHVANISPFTLELLLMQDKIDSLTNRIKFITERLEI